MKESMARGESGPLIVFDCVAISTPWALDPANHVLETSERGTVGLALEREKARALLRVAEGALRGEVWIGDGVALCPRFDAAALDANGEAAGELPYAIVAPVRCRDEVVASALNWWTNHHGIARLTVNAAAGRQDARTARDAPAQAAHRARGNPRAGGGLEGALPQTLDAAGHRGQRRAGEGNRCGRRSGTALCGCW